MKISVWDHYALIASRWAGLASDTAQLTMPSLMLALALPSPLCLRALVCVSSVTLTLLSPVHRCSSISLETIQPHSCYCCCLVVCFIFIYLRQDLLYLGVTSSPQTHHVTMDNHGLFFGPLLFTFKLLGLQAYAVILDLWGIEDGTHGFMHARQYSTNSVTLPSSIPLLSCIFYFFVEVKLFN